jgi:hypothetical protein
MKNQSQPFKKIKEVQGSRAIANPSLTPHLFFATALINLWHYYPFKQYKKRLWGSAPQSFFISI